MSLIGMNEAERDAYFAAGQPHDVYGPGHDDDGNPCLEKVSTWYGPPSQFTHGDSRSVSVPSATNETPAIASNDPGHGYPAWAERQQQNRVSESSLRRMAVENENARLRAQGEELDRGTKTLGGWLNRLLR